MHFIWHQNSLHLTLWQRIGCSIKSIFRNFIIIIRCEHYSEGWQFGYMNIEHIMCAYQKHCHFHESHRLLWPQSASWIITCSQLNSIKLEKKKRTVHVQLKRAIVKSFKYGLRLLRNSFTAFADSMTERKQKHILIFSIRCEAAI